MRQIHVSMIPRIEIFRSKPFSFHLSSMVGVPSLDVPSKPICLPNSISGDPRGRFQCMGRECSLLKGPRSSFQLWSGLLSELASLRRKNGISERRSHARRYETSGRFPSYSSKGVGNDECSAPTCEGEGFATSASGKWKLLEQGTRRRQTKG